MDAVFVTFYKSITDGPTDGWTDTASYRDARTHLKMMRGWFVSGITLYLNNG